MIMMSKKLGIALCGKINNPVSSPVLEPMITLNEHDINNRAAFMTDHNDNLTRGECLALSELSNMKYQIFKLVDKG